MKKMHIATFSALCMMLLTACSGGAAAQTAVADVPRSGKIQVESTDTQVITVTSSESVSVVPDMAEIVYAITTQNKDAAACQSENGTKTDSLKESLKGMGIDEKSIKTSNYNLNPQYDWEKNGGEIVGYEMTAEITVSDVPMDLVGKLLASSVGAGVNQIQSVTYQSSSYDASYQEALKQAVTKAQEKAQTLADASGVTLGHAVRITESGSDQTARYRNTVSMSASKDTAGMGAAAELMPGEIQVEANISVEFAIQ